VSPAVLPAWFDHLEENFSFEEVQSNTFCLPRKTNYLPAENEAPVDLELKICRRHMSEGCLQYVFGECKR